MKAIGLLYYLKCIFIIDKYCNSYLPFIYRSSQGLESSAQSSMFRTSHRRMYEDGKGMEGIIHITLVFSVMLLDYKEKKH